VKRHNVGELRRILEDPALRKLVGINRKDLKKSWTLLHWACWSGFAEGVDLLLTQSDLKLNSRDLSGATPFHLACRQGHERIVRTLLLKESLDPNERGGPDSSSPLFEICRHRHHEILSLMVANPRVEVNTTIGDVTEVVKRQVAGADGDHGGGESKPEEVIVYSSLSPLHYCCKEGDADAVAILVAGRKTHVNTRTKRDQGADANKVPFRGMAPLHVACDLGHLEVVRELMRCSRLDCNLPRDDTGQGTALALACERGHAAIVQELLKNPELVTKKVTHGGFSALHLACFHGHVEVVRTLLQDGRVAPTVTQANGITPLFTACEKGFLDVVTLLLEDSRTRINSTNGVVNTTALGAACLRGNIPLVDLILSRPEVDVNPGKIGPLFIACDLSSVELVQRLLAVPECSPNIKAHGDCTPFLLACEKANTDVIKVLIDDPRVRVNVKREDGSSGLTHLTSRGLLSVIKYVMLQRPELEVGTTVCELARTRGYLDIATLLDAFRADPKKVKGDLTREHDETLLRSRVVALELELAQFREVFGTRPAEVPDLQQVLAKLGSAKREREALLKRLHSTLEKLEVATEEVVCLRDLMAREQGKVTTLQQKNDYLSQLRDLGKTQTADLREQVSELKARGETSATFQLQLETCQRQRTQLEEEVCDLHETARRLAETIEGERAERVALQQLYNDMLDRVKQDLASRQQATEKKQQLVSLAPSSHCADARRVGTLLVNKATQTATYHAPPEDALAVIQVPEKQDPVKSDPDLDFNQEVDMEMDIGDMEDYGEGESTPRARSLELIAQAPWRNAVVAERDPAEMIKALGRRLVTARTRTKELKGMVRAQSQKLVRERRGLEMLAESWEVLSLQVREEAKERRVADAGWRHAEKKVGRTEKTLGEVQQRLAQAEASRDWLRQSVALWSGESPQFTPAASLLPQGLKGAWELKSSSFGGVFGLRMGSDALVAAKILPLSPSITADPSIAHALKLLCL